MGADYASQYVRAFKSDRLWTFSGLTMASLSTVDGRSSLSFDRQLDVISDQWANKFTATL